MKKLFLILVLFGFIAAYSQEPNKVIVDPQLKKKVLIGKCDREGLKTDVFEEHFAEGYASYHPDEKTIKQLKRLKKGVQIVVVMASWCSDSQEQVPHFYKVLDEIKFDEDHIELIAVDRNKTGGDFDVSGLDIKRVPTFVFYKEGRELGRIVESPSGSLEKDMLLIFMQGS